MELLTQQKVVKGKVAKETVVERPLVEWSANEKIVAEGAVTKKWQVD